MKKQGMLGSYKIIRDWQQSLHNRQAAGLWFWQVESRAYPALDEVCGWNLATHTNGYSRWKMCQKVQFSICHWTQARNGSLETWNPPWADTLADCTPWAWSKESGSQKAKKANSRTCRYGRRPTNTWNIIIGIIEKWTGERCNETNVGTRNEATRGRSVGKDREPSIWHSGSYAGYPRILADDCKHTILRRQRWKNGTKRWEQNF